jgi:hypothetical protein
MVTKVIPGTEAFSLETQCMTTSIIQQSEDLTLGGTMECTASQGSRLPGEASKAASLRRPVEYDGHEHVPGVIPNFQLSNRRIGNGKMQIIDVRSGSSIAVRSGRAFGPRRGKSRCRRPGPPAVCW